MFFFVCLLRDYAANYESILVIIFLLGRVDLRDGPILILSKLIYLLKNQQKTQMLFWFVIL